MAKLPSVFNAEKHSGRMGFNVIPAGKYKSRIVKSEMKKTKDGTGTILVMQEKVVEGQHKGSILFIRLNLVNKNDQAVQIAQNELATICDACKKPAVKDSEELHGIDHYIEVGIKPADDNYPESNVIKNYLPLSKGKPTLSKSDDEENEEENEEVEESEENDESSEENEEEEQQEEPEPTPARRKPIFGGRKK